MSEALSEAERSALEALGYTLEWIDSGLLDRKLLATQYEKLQAGGTGKTGRYRAQTLALWRERTPSLEDAQIDACLSLMRTDPDVKMAQGAISELI